jgi:DNA gyrase subunit A
MNENNISKVIPVDIGAEMKKSFIDYAMSVIVDRALPDVRDGLKPVHRRILYAMFNLGFTSDKAFRKCATTVGEVLGKFHPHGDAAVYESMVRMAQNFSLRYMLVDGHGNFGSVDGDSPAAMRYTEARLSKISMEMLSDINKNTVDFKPNFDEHEIEPVVLPSRFPNLLVNGSTGIAVGMATNIPPHNLGETIDGIIRVIDEPEVEFDELIKIIKGPDFPTAGTIVGRAGIRDAYQTGRGKVVVRAEATIEAMANNRQRIVVTELPYQVNKARLIEKIAELVKDKKIEGISDLRDESDREGMRMVVELKREANANVVLNQLYKNTQLQEAFHVNMLALVLTDDKKFEPKILNLRHVIDHYIKHQKEVTIRRTQFELDKAEARAHILEGLKIAIDNLDEVIRIIRASKNESSAKESLMARFSFSDKQAQAIVDMRLGRLTALEREKLDNEYNEVMEKIKYLKSVLANDFMVLGIIKDELKEIRSKFADERRTKIIADESDFDVEDLIQKEENVITLTHFGYIKRLKSDTYKLQKRGGKGVIGLSTREEDFVENLFVTTTHHLLLFFTNKGRAFRLKAYEIPESGRQAKGTAIVNLLNISSDEKITAVIPVEDFSEGKYLIMATKHGIIKKTNLMDFSNIRRNGLTAVNLRDGDELIDVKLTDGTKEILLVTVNGMSIMFQEKNVRPMGRNSMGVKALRFKTDDFLVTMEVCDEKKFVLIITEGGYGKRVKLEEYRLQGRGGTGIITYKPTSKTGKVSGMRLVNEDDEVMLISADNSIIRIKAKDINCSGRTAQGVILMRMDQGTKVVGLARIAAEDDSEEDNVDGNVDGNVE